MCVEGYFEGDSECFLVHCHIEVYLQVLTTHLSWFNSHRQLVLYWLVASIIQIGCLLAFQCLSCWMQGYKHSGSSPEVHRIDEIYWTSSSILIFAYGCSFSVTRSCIHLECNVFNSFGLPLGKCLYLHKNVEPRLSFLLQTFHVYSTFLSIETAATFLSQAVVVPTKAIVKSCKAKGLQSIRNKSLFCQMSTVQTYLSFFFIIVL